MLLAIPWAAGLTHGATGVPHILSDSPSFYRLQLDLHQLFGKDMDGMRPLRQQMPPAQAAGT